jgi:hypothetical protein
MGDRLVVDIDGLANLSSALTRITDGLNATRRTIDGVRADLGSGDLWDALDDFENNWDDGRGQINKNMVAMREVIDDSVKAYADADAELERQLREQSAPRES